jgi:amino acid adenylation domain-containing protein
LTYLELNQRANQLAHYLQKRGVGPDGLVGICLERSTQMLVGLLGILKAGAAYVPLDPSYPAERLAFILEDTQVPILLTQQRLLASLPESAARMLVLDTDWQEVALESVENPPPCVNGENLAYVMYTSGSTGRPKGVMVCHRGVSNYLCWRQITFPLRATDRALQKTSFGFVDSIWELFEPLMVGAQVLMARPDGHQDPAYLAQFIAEQHITVADFIPSLLQLFLEQPGVEQCSTLRRVTTGSETVTMELQERFFAHFEAHLYNLYGPTEASIASTCWRCERGSILPTVPIGRPIANTQIYVLDQTGEPVPVGMPGEIYIGGVGLARGYLNSPELTAEQFLPHPFSQVPGARLYRTGDVGRYRPDGNLEFLGRADHQVKIRGFRVELGEIEAVLGQHPIVQEVAIRAWQDSAGQARLAAYVVPVPGQNPTPHDLRNFLKQKLPAYMVPAAMVFLDTMPLTANGKVNRRALPRPEESREVDTAFVAPRTPVEQHLAEIWAQVLRLPQVGIHDDFFALGGHSLMAIQIVSRIRQRLQVELPVQALFETPTIAELAVTITQNHLTAGDYNEIGRLLAEVESMVEEHFP